MFPFRSAQIIGTTSRRCLLNNKFLQKHAQRNGSLKQEIASMIPKQIEIIKKLRKEHGKAKLGDITVNMVYGGMRGMLGLLCETSLLDKDEGIRFRNLTIADCQELLPKADGGEEPLPEGMFYLLCTGQIPTQEEVKEISSDWANRGKLPDHVVKLIANLPKDLHPMSLFSAGVLALQHDSQFAKAIAEGAPKAKYWEYCYEDSMELIAKCTTLAALVYNHCYRSGSSSTNLNSSLDWSANFMNMMGYSDQKFTELMRLYLTIHCDHEGGNVSAHATKLVGSALADPYLSFSAGINGLAGPLHGLANQEVLKFLVLVQEKVGKDASKEKVGEFVKEFMKSGRVIPGYGHAVLRKTDPRFTCQREFGLKHLPDDEMLKLVGILFEVVPPILQATGKVQNPWPNVDAHSGVLLQYYGLKEMNFYTVLFGVSRALGVLASLIWDRALGLPIERPKSASTCCLLNMVNKK